MKRARKMPVKPRNPVAQAPILKKGGAHTRRDKHASRARLRDQIKQRLREDQF